VTHPACRSWRSARRIRRSSHWLGPGSSLRILLSAAWASVQIVIDFGPQSSPMPYQQYCNVDASRAIT
jgi:hypothetical protein